MSRLICVHTGLYDNALTSGYRIKCFAAFGKVQGPIVQGIVKLMNSSVVDTVDAWAYSVNQDQTASEGAV